MLFPSYLSNQPTPSKISVPSSPMDDSGSCCSFDDSNRGQQVCPLLKLFNVGKYDSSPFLIHINVSKRHSFNQGFDCNFHRSGCSEFFKRRRTFLTFVATPAFSAICLAVKLKFDVLHIITRAVRHCHRSRLFLSP